MGKILFFSGGQSLGPSIGDMLLFGSKFQRHFSATAPSFTSFTSPCTGRCSVNWCSPIYPSHVLFHGYVQSTHPVFSRFGDEEFVMHDKGQTKAGEFFHQLHHRYFGCNDETVDVSWFGRYGDDSAQTTNETRARKKQM
ncbi:MAG: hypothetical protein ABJ360_14715 [Roseobacter sp.]